MEEEPYKGVEVWDLIEKMPFNLGNAVKYIAWAGKTGPEREVEDLKKAVAYLEREIERTQGRRTAETDYGSLPDILASQMENDRGLAVLHICRTRSSYLKVAIHYLTRAILKIRTIDTIEDAYGLKFDVPPIEAELTSEERMRQEDLHDPIIHARNEMVHQYIAQATRLAREPNYMPDLLVKNTAREVIRLFY